MKILYNLLIFSSFLFSSSPAFTQSWQWATQLGGAGNEAANSGLQAANGDLIIAGSYSEAMTVAGQQLVSEGKEDLYLVRLDAAGNPLWATGAGGVDVDRTSALGQDAAGDLYWAGTYWQEIEFDGTVLQSEGGAKAIFIVKYTAEGQLVWARTLRASGLKEVGDMEVDEAGNLFLTGYFGGELTVADTLIQSRGEADLFVIKMDAGGQLSWVASFGESGFIRGIKLALGAAGSINVCGHFKGELIINQDTIRTNTSDNDVFVAQFDSTGKPLWGRKAGGVHEDFCTGLALDENDGLYVSGYYYGVLKLGDGIEIQASGFHDNSFLLRYASDGTPLSAQSFGGSGLVHVLDVQYQDGELLLAGYFRDQLNIAVLSLVAQADFDSFVAAFRAEDGSLDWLEPLPSSAFMLIDELLYLDESDFLCIGSFTGTATLDPLQLASSGAFNAFVARGSRMTTSVSPAAAPSPMFTAFPNPARERLFIRTELTTYSVEVCDPLGRRLLLMDSSPAEIPLAGLARGVYYLTFRYPSGQRTLSFVKE